MSGLGVLRRIEGGFLAFRCPGCQFSHYVRVTTGNRDWGFNGDYDRPTFTPSILVAWAHPKGYTNENPAPVGFPSQKERPDLWTEERCHTFVCDGQIQFLGDCTHALAGKTVPLEAF